MCRDGVDSPDGDGGLSGGLPMKPLYDFRTSVDGVVLLKGQPNNGRA